MIDATAIDTATFTSYDIGLLILLTFMFLMFSIDANELLSITDDKDYPLLCLTMQFDRGVACYGLPH